ncbi:MAG: glycosyltransferase [Solirubrobacterales bacterium]|nr:glycosyltransferase [Solirubrobacterales bacterium]
MRILLVSQMYPGPADPDLGAFVAQIERELVAQGHRVERAVIDRRGGRPTKYARLLADALRTARSFRPDVVFGHFLVPAGAIAAAVAAAGRLPVVLMAHGRDVRNVGEIPGAGVVTRLAAARAATVIANSAYLRAELLDRVPALAGRVEVIDCGVDLERFRGRDGVAARVEVGWDGPAPRFLFVGGLDDRKNVLRLVEAFRSLGRGSLVLVGDGPLRARVKGAPGVTTVGRVPHERVGDWIAACEVLCLPSTVEPLGQVVLEAMASERSVVATRVGGPPELVPPEAGVLVNPESTEDIAAGMAAAAELPSPNVAARRAAAEHDVRRQAARMAGVLEKAVRERR